MIDLARIELRLSSRLSTATDINGRAGIMNRKKTIDLLMCETCDPKSVVPAAYPLKTSSSALDAVFK